MACCGWIKTYWRQINLLLAIVGLLLAIFDLASDWWVFNEYVSYGGGEVAVTLGVVCFIGTVLFLFEVYVSILAISFYSKKQPESQSSAHKAKRQGHEGKKKNEVDGREEDDEDEERRRGDDDDDDDDDDDEEIVRDVQKEETKKLNRKTSSRAKAEITQNYDKMMQALHEFDDEEDHTITRYQREEFRVSRWEEIVSFLLLVFEDLPTAALLYYAFEEGKCDVFIRIYKDTNAAYIALLSAFLSCLWKGIMSFRYCLSCRFHDLRGFEARFLCCFCRIFRPIAALSLCSFIAYIVFEIKEIRALPPLSDNVCEHIQLARERY